MAKANPGEVSYAAWATGSPMQLSGALLEKVTGTQMKSVSLISASGLVPGLDGGGITFSFVAVPTLKTIRDKVKVIAVASSQPIPDAAGVATLADAGFAGFEETQPWIGLVAPAATPGPAVDRLSQELRKAIARPDVRARIQEIGGQPVSDSAEQFTAFLKTSFDLWSGIVANSATIQNERLQREQVEAEHNRKAEARRARAEEDRQTSLMLLQGLAAIASGAASTAAQNRAQINAARQGVVLAPQRTGDPIQASLAQTMQNIEGIRQQHAAATASGGERGLDVINMQSTCEQVTCKPQITSCSQATSERACYEANACIYRCFASMAPTDPRRSEWLKQADEADQQVARHSGGTRFKPSDAPAPAATSAVNVGQPVSDVPRITRESRERTGGGGGQATGVGSAR